MGVGVVTALTALHPSQPSSYLVNDHTQEAPPGKTRTGLFFFFRLFVLQQLPTGVGWN